MQMQAHRFTNILQSFCQTFGILAIVIHHKNFAYVRYEIARVAHSHFFVFMLLVIVWCKARFTEVVYGDLCQSKQSVIKKSCIYLVCTQCSCDNRRTQAQLDDRQSLAAN